MADPVGVAGQSEGYCDPLWAKPGSSVPEPTLPPPNPTNMFNCIFSGGKWVDGKCIMPDPVVTARF